MLHINFDSLLLVVELDYLPDLEVCFSHAWIPFLDGGACPLTNSVKGVQGTVTIKGAPPWRGIRGKRP